MVTLYDDPISGNGYKVRLTLSQLGIRYRYHALDITRNETRTPEFLAVNPNGKIPAVVLDDGRPLFESNAIIWYFAQTGAAQAADSDSVQSLVPVEPFAQAQVLQWMSFEQYSHEPKVAVARFIMLHTKDDDSRRNEIPECHEGGYRALDVMEDHLQKRAFFVEDTYSIADIALYAYTHVAEQGGFDLSSYPAVRRWLKDVASQPGHIRITDI